MFSAETVIEAMERLRGDSKNPPATLREKTSTTEADGKVRAFVYRRYRVCAYTYPDGSHCMIGAALMELGLELPDRESEENYIGVRGLLNRNYFGLFDPGAVDIMESAQSMADSYMQWGMVAAWMRQAIPRP